MLLFQNIRRKTRTGFALALLLLCLVLNNIISQEHFESIEKAATSIYEDRLLASGYIFEIREHLYAARTSSQEGLQRHEDAFRRRQASIASVVGRYEQTLLTRQEQSALQALKTNLDNYFVASPAGAGQHFTAALGNLGTLLQIQQREGNHLKRDMVHTAQLSTLSSYAALCLLIAVAALTVAFIRQSRHILQPDIPGNPSLN